MKTKNIVLSGLFIALGLVVPMAFHQFGMGGQVFLPMHLPVLIAGLFLGPIEGFLVGMGSVVLSTVLTGMPPVFPMMPIMIVELAIYGLVAGILYKKMKQNIFVSLISSMILGRIASAIVVYILIKFFGFKAPGAITFVMGGVATALPGIAIQLVFVPLIVKTLERATK